MGEGEGTGRLYIIFIYLSLHCHHQNDSFIKMGSGKSHFNVSLIVRDKVTRQCLQITTFLKRRESQSGIKLRPFCLLAQTGLLNISKVISYVTLSQVNPQNQSLHKHKIKNNKKMYNIYIICKHQTQILKELIPSIFITTLLKRAYY